MKRCGVVILMLLMGISTTFAQDSLNVTMVGRLYNYWDIVYGVAVSGNYAYVADATAGVWVVNVSNPALPIEVGYYHTTWGAQDVAVDGDYTFVAAGSAGLRVLDVSNPAA